MRIPVAVFVKTPGLSPVKSRLGAEIGATRALDFYLKSVDATLRAVEEATKREMRLFPLWAVAEVDGLDSPLWQGWPRQLQLDPAAPAEDLGSRLDHVYATLLRNFENQGVILLGADCPHMSPDRLLEAAQILTGAGDVRSSCPWVLGPSLDGGFYLFGGRTPVPNELWRRVPYSASNTCERLAHELQALGGEIRYLPSLRDVDTREDLVALATEQPEWRGVLGDLERR